MKKKIIFIGNSIVAGYPWSKGRSFVSQVRNALKGDVPAPVDQAADNQPGSCRTVILSQPDFAKATGFEILNKGANGDTTAGILGRFSQDVLDQQPDMVFILTGTNDFIYRDATPEEAFSNMEFMAKLCEGSGAEGAKADLPGPDDTCNNLGIIPIYITPIPVDAGKAEFMWLAGCGISYPAVNRDIDMLSELIRNSGRPYVDLNRLYPEFVAEKGDPDLAYMDGIHPMPDGYTFIAKQVLNFMSENADTLKL